MPTPFPLPFDPFAVTLGGLPLIPTIIYVLQALKTLIPKKYRKGQLWRALALLGGALGMVAIHLKTSGTPADAFGWLVVIVMGLVFGCVAMYAYDSDKADKRTAAQG